MYFGGFKEYTGIIKFTFVCIQFHLLNPKIIVKIVLVSRKNFGTHFKQKENNDSDYQFVMLVNFS